MIYVSPANSYCGQQMWRHCAVLRHPIALNRCKKEELSKTRRVANSLSERELERGVRIATRNFGCNHFSCETRLKE